MKVFNRGARRNWQAIFGAALVGSFGGSFLALPTAHANLVLDSQTQGVQQSGSVAATADPDSARLEQRESTRKVMEASEKAQDTLQAQAQTPQAQPTTAPLPQVVVQQPPQQVAQALMAQPAVAQAPSAVVAQTAVTATPEAAAGSPDVENLSQAQLLRRERLRTELKNEDLLETRLEQLRLKDEEKRTGLLSNIQEGDGAPAVAPSGAAAPMTNQVVTAPITDHPGQQVGQVVAQPAVAAQAGTAPVAQGAVVTDTIKATNAAPTDPADSSIFDGKNDSSSVVTIRPMGGVSSMGSDPFFDVHAKYAAGIGLGVDVSDNLSVDLGYTFSEYGVQTAAASPLGQAAINTMYYTTGVFSTPTTQDTYTLKQNVIDAGLKLHFLGHDSKLRPYIAGGGGYAKSYLNFSDAILQLIGSMPATTGATSDYETNCFLGYVGAGFDVALSKSVSLGASVKYYSVLSSSSNTALPTSLWATSYSTYLALDEQVRKEALSTQMAQTGFYTIGLGVSFAL